MVAFLRRSTTSRYVVGDDPRPIAMSEDDRVEGRKEAHRRRHPGGCEPSPRQVEEHAAVVVLVRAETVEDGRDLPHLESRELLDVVTGRRAVPGEIVADDARSTFLGRRERPAPRDRGRRLRVRPVAHRLGADPRERAKRERDRPAVAGAEQTAGERDGVLDRLVGPSGEERSRIDTEAGNAAALGLDVRRLDERIQIARDDVERPPHDAGLDRRAVTESVRELGLAKARATRPERDVGRRRVLRLQRDQTRDHVEQGTAGSREQELPEQERAIQLTARERPQGITAAFSSPGGGSANSAGRSASSTRCDTSRSHGYAPLARNPSAARTVAGVWWKEPRIVSSS